MNNITLFTIIGIIGLYSLSFSIAYGQTTVSCINGIVLHVIEIHKIFQCYEDRITVLENNPAGADQTTASNIGTSGVGVFSSEVGNDLQFKKLISSNNVTLGITSNGTNVIFVPSTGSESTVCNNLGTSGIIVCTGGNVNLRRFISANNATLSIQANSTNVIFNNLAPESTDCFNAGGLGDTLVASSSGGDCTIKRLVDGRGMNFVINGTRITIDLDTKLLTGVTGGVFDTCNESPSRGSLIFGDLNTSGNCAGTPTIKWNELLVGTAGQYLRTNGTDAFWASGSNQTDTDDLISQSVGEIFQSLTKTNIGTSYVDIYITAFDEENKFIIDCANVTYANVIYQWDYVGVGTQQLRWVDVSNNANVFYESPTFTTDRDATDSGYFAKPSWCTGKVTLEQQGKSTTAGDDPIAKGYKIMVK